MKAYKQFVDNIEKVVKEDTKLKEEITKDPIATIKKLAKLIPEPLRFDVWIYRMVVFALGVTLFVTVLGAIVIVILSGTVPDILIAIGSAAVGALAGLLAPSPKGSEE